MIARILAIVFGAILISGGMAVFNFVPVYEGVKKEIVDLRQQLLESNYRFEKEVRRLKSENHNQAETIKIQQALAREQQRLIDLQSRLAIGQKTTIKKLETDLGDAASVIDELKRTGGEPLPKDFINQLLQATVRIRCNIAEIPGGGVRIKAGSGSLLGRYEAASGDAVLMTNAHVIARNESTGEYNCFAIFGEDIYYNVFVVRSVRENGLDFALLRLGAPVTKTAPVITYTDLGVGFCEFEDVSLNDYVTILSYPGFAGPDKAVSVGRVAGVYDGPVYEASALVDQGSSGGVAILNKKRCLLGMPTWKGVGERLGLSYIQSWPMMLSFQ
jgi:hypothetical protein